MISVTHFFSFEVVGDRLRKERYSLRDLSIVSHGVRIVPNIGAWYRYPKFLLCYPKILLWPTQKFSFVTQNFSFHGLETLIFLHSFSPN